MSRKLSVIVPVYNAERYIGRCTKSILGQTYKNIEVILVNDGSTDNSLNLCYQIAEMDSKVKVLTKENAGAASARNMGIKNATGELLGFCDADDFLDADMYEVLINIMEQNNLKMIDSTYKSVNDSGEIIEKGIDSKELVIESAYDAISNLFLWIGGSSLCTRVVDKSLFENLNIPEGKRAEDFYTSICLINNNGENAVYKYPFYNYFYHSGSVTKSKGASIYLDALYFREKALSGLKNKYDLEKAAEFFKFKCYYLFSVSVINKEFKKYKDEIKEIKNDLKSLQNNIKSCPYLVKKEKLVLKIARYSMRFSRFLYLSKNIVSKKKY